MSNFERAFIKAIAFAVVPVVMTFSLLLAGSIRADALPNPLAGKPLSFDEMLPYLSEGQPIYRSGTGDNGDNPLGIVIEPSSEKDGKAASNEEMSMEEEMFGSEQVFPFEPGLGNGGRT